MTGFLSTIESLTVFRMIYCMTYYWLWLFLCCTSVVVYASSITTSIEIIIFIFRIGLIKPEIRSISISFCVSLAVVGSMTCRTGMKINASRFILLPIQVCPTITIIVSVAVSCMVSCWTYFRIFRYTRIDISIAVCWMISYITSYITGYC